MANFFMVLCGILGVGCAVLFAVVRHRGKKISELESERMRLADDAATVREWNSKLQKELEIEKKRYREIASGLARAGSMPVGDVLDGLRVAARAR